MRPCIIHYNHTHVAVLLGNKTNRAACAQLTSPTVAKSAEFLVGEDAMRIMRHSSAKTWARVCILYTVLVCVRIIIFCTMLECP
jgi:hypothetical protein